METDSSTYCHSYRSQSIYSEIYLKADLVILKCKSRNQVPNQWLKGVTGRKRVGARNW